MNGKVLIVLALAGLCGLAAMFGVRSILGRQSTEEIPMHEVLVATREIRVEETITEEMVTLKPMPADQVPPGSFTELEQVAGRWAKMPMLAGDPIREEKLAEKGMPTGMLAKVPTGKRAFAISVDEQRGVSGFILPDYRVDVIQPNPGEGSGARVIVEDARVLASGSVIESSEDRSIQARTVTLEVTPEQVRLLAGAMQRGPLMLTLRGLDDHALTAELPEPEPEPTPPPEPVEALAVEPAEGEGDPPRRLAIFSGRGAVRVWRISDGGAAEGDEPARVEERAGPAVRRPYRLDAPEAAGVSAAEPSD